MDAKKLIIFLLIAVTAFGMFTACATNATEITVTLNIKAGDDKIFNSKIKVNVENPTVINVVNEAIATYGLDITLDSNGNSVSKIKNYYDTEIDGITYYWMYTINGVEPTTGKASSNNVADGDEIEYVFYSSDPGTNPPTTLKSRPYKSEWELFGEGEESAVTSTVETAG